MKPIPIIVGVVVGLIAGLIFEYINGFFTFMLPPFLIITPLCVITGGIIAIYLQRRP